MCRMQKMQIQRPVSKNQSRSLAVLGYRNGHY
nr:MAG TPA: hypothetical protein [Caudoviricetes sp.]